jgi:DUF177 domain-containing protein
MPVSVNLRHLEAHPLSLSGELSVPELDINPLDEVIQVRRPLQYELEIELLEGGLLVQGHLHLDLDCQCVRCLKAFSFPLDLPEWQAHVALEGEDAVTPVNDCVDLTPVVREDILLEFPRHPVCQPGCGGLPRTHLGQTAAGSSSTNARVVSPAWAELNKLKF